MFVNANRESVAENDFYNSTLPNSVVMYTRVKQL